MKHTFIFILSVTSIILFVSGCKKEENKIVTLPTSSNGSLMLWTDKPDNFTTCGPSLLITLNNGNSSIVTNYYATPPVGCSDRFGGYFSLPAGNYTYSITTIGTCPIRSGTAVVDSGSCTAIKIP